MAILALSCLAAAAAGAALPPEEPAVEWSACDGAQCADVRIIARTPSSAAFVEHEEGWTGPGPYRHFTVYCPAGMTIEAAEFIDSDYSDCAHLRAQGSSFVGGSNAHFVIDFDHDACPAFHTSLRIRCR